MGNEKAYKSMTDLILNRGNLMLNLLVQKNIQTLLSKDLAIEFSNAQWHALIPRPPFTCEMVKDRISYIFRWANQVSLDDTHPNMLINFLDCVIMNDLKNVQKHFSGENLG